MIAIIMDNQVLFEAPLTVTSWEGGTAECTFCPSRLVACGSGLRYGDHPVRLSQ